MNNDGQALPQSVIDFVEYLGGWAEGYGYLKWNEQAKLKADMMNSRVTWVQVDADALKAKCLDVGLSKKETAEILDWLKRIKEGRRLVPNKGYSAYKWPHDEEIRRSGALGD